MTNSADSDGLPEEVWVPPALSPASVASVDETLRKLWGDQPDEPHDVVIVLAGGSEEATPESLGLKSYEAIPYQPGMFKASMCGTDLLSLAARAEVEEIVPDEDVSAL